jgi:hypothetical protein
LGYRYEICMYVCMLLSIYMHLIFGGVFGVTDMYVYIILYIYKHLIFGGVFGVTDMYICMLLSMYKHLIFGGGDWGYRARGAAHEEEGAEAVTVAEHNQGREFAASDDDIKGAGGGPIEVSRAVKAAVEDQKLLW